MKIPTSEEIEKARDEIESDAKIQKTRENVEQLHGLLKVVGRVADGHWITSYGILIGLQIAENRKAEK